MECNIGEKGKAARLRLGLMALAGALALALVILGGFVEGAIWWYGVGGATLGGLFTIWEARAGWCIVRAMGFKTPL
tara:strand:+ start:466 stop:693 length:228 start_codon:yes stop_codon:yes gene_type:complete